MNSFDPDGKDKVIAIYIVNGNAGKCNEKEAFKVKDANEHSSMQILFGYTDGEVT